MRGGFEMAYTGIKRKVFISHYKGDKNEVNAFIDEFANKHKVFTPYVLGANENDDFINSTNPTYVMSQIRKKYLQDTTVTIVLGKVRTSIPRTKNENFSHLISMGYQ